MIACVPPCTTTSSVLTDPSPIWTAGSSLPGARDSVAAGSAPLTNSVWLDVLARLTVMPAAGGRGAGDVEQPGRADHGAGGRRLRQGEVSGDHLPMPLDDLARVEPVDLQRVGRRLVLALERAARVGLGLRPLRSTGDCGLYTTSLIFDTAVLSESYLNSSEVSEEYEATWWILKSDSRSECSLICVLVIELAAT